MMNPNPTNQDKLQSLQIFFAQKKAWLPSTQSVLLTTIGMIMVMSLLMVTSASMPFAQSKKLDDFYFLIHQLAYMVLGCVLAWIMTKIELKKLYNLNYILTVLFLTIAVIIYTVFFGSVINGSKRWVEVAGFNFQPVELVKIVMILYTAEYLVRRSPEVRYSWFGFARLAGLAGVLALVIMAQPDFGAVVIIACCLASMIFVAGLPKRQFLVILGLMVVGGTIGVFTASYRQSRILSFLDPFDDLQNTDYQLGRSIAAFGRGEFFGMGYGESIQKLSHLPEAHTDFLLAITGEELGFVGVAFILILQIVLVATIMKISYDELKRHHIRLSYFAFGVATLFFGQIFVNAGMNMGLLPTKGLTMPFFSYGGSSMVVNLLTVGILLRILKESPTIPPEQKRHY